MTRSRFARLLRYGAWALLIIIAALVAAEGALRLVPRQNYVKQAFLSEGYTVPKNDAYGYDIAANFATSTFYFPPDPHPIWSNAYGCFDTPFAPGTKPYVYVADDSFAWGFAPFESKWPTLLEELLSIRIAKCGVPGYGISQELSKAESNISRMGPPSLMVVQFYRNDFADDTWMLDPDYEPLRNAYPSRYVCIPSSLIERVECWTWFHSALMWVFFGSHFEQWYAPLTQYGSDTLPGPADPGKYTKESILRFKDLAASSGARLLFVIAAAKASVADSTEGRASEKEIEAFLDAQGIQYLDLYPDFKKFSSANPKALYWENDVHFNEKGNAVAGLLAGQFIIQHGLVSVADAQERLAMIRERLAALSGELLPRAQ